jgi:hypothetical protein
MARPNTCDTSGLAYGGFAGSGLSPADVEQYKLDRLRELRAIVDSLRSQRGQDLLANARAERDRL